MKIKIFIFALEFTQQVVVKFLYNFQQKIKDSKRYQLIAMNKSSQMLMKSNTIKLMDLLSNMQKLPELADFHLLALKSAGKKVNISNVCKILRTINKKENKLSPRLLLFNKIFVQIVSICSNSAQFNLLNLISIYSLNILSFSLRRTILFLTF